MGNYRPFLQGPLPVANYTRIIIPGRFWTRPPSTKSTCMASSATPLHDSLIELAIPDAHAHAIKWYLKKDLVLLRTEFRAALDSPPDNGAQRQQISDLTDTVAALRMEITQLKETLSSMSSELTSLRSSRPPIDKPTYASKASTRRIARPGSAHHPNTTQRQTGGRGDRKQLNVRGAAVTPGSGDTASQRLPKPMQRTTPRENSRKSEKKIIVEGARRIWGTMKACPSSVVLSTIAKVTEIKDELRIKKKKREAYQATS